MTRKLDKQKAITMRKQGLSYSQIKNKLKVSKSTLSLWLASMPLSEKRIRELRSDNPVRIERFRNTMRSKKEVRLNETYKKVSKDIGILTERDLFIAGLFLYWGEGTKTKDYSVEFTNTNPYMIKFFIRWLRLLNISKKDLKIKLHLYEDMNINEAIDFWQKELRIDKEQFYRPYIKKNSKNTLNYKKGFGKGTCSVIFNDRDLHEYILISLKYLSKIS